MPVLYVPCTQEMQPVLFEPLEYVPATQEMQAVLFDPLEYVPGTQVMQAVLLDPPEYVPGAQEMQPVLFDLSEYVPATHSKQELDPARVLYVPGRQERHAAEEFEPETGLNQPEGQLTHVLACKVVLYVPLAQVVQALDPRPEENVPALHWVQTVDDHALGVLLKVPMAQSMHVTVPFAKQMP